MRIWPSFLGTILLAGCYGHPDPAPRPHNVVVAGSPTATKRDSTPPLNGTAATTAGAERLESKEHADVSSVEVARRAADVFGDSLIVVPPAAAVAAAEPTWDMDVRSYETQDRVAYYVNMFTGRSKERIAERLERGTRYEPMIRAKMKAGGLPEDMYYLALVESGFDPHAYSRAAAVGMWQFMTSTARDMGMRVDWWVDERRDPVRSTTAAVRFIRGLRDQFGSLYLAAAAYNGGPGRVSRGLARFADDLEGTQAEDAFFVLAEKDYLRNETREYVPQLIAAALIAKEPTRYGMELRPRAPFAYDSVRVPGSTPLGAIAKAAKVSLREITDLNSHLLRGMTPPRETYLIRVPVGSAAEFDSAFAALPAEARKATVTVETKKGDTPERIARQYDVPTSAVAAFNPSMHRLKSGRLSPGQELVVPTPAVLAAALDIPDPGIEKYPNSTSRLKVHTVRRGESLRLVARKYDVSPERLMRLNGLRKPVIFPGQTLLLTAAPRSSKSKARSTESSSSSRKSSASRSSKVSGKSKASVSSRKKAAATEKPSSARSTKKSSGAGSKAGARKNSGKSAKRSSRAD
ncbi:MAG TPA: transglycosylase SLT domain-containing protein [Gemmatimonadaceae bacterium]|nr:transglycosylase SLT domain-containing protein [Gemmatimonadaceae bacterium]